MHTFIGRKKLTEDMRETSIQWIHVVNYVKYLTEIHEVDNPINF